MRKLRALIVDDDEDIRRLVSINLLTGPIDVVGEAADGQQAVEMAREMQPDVVVMDLMLPVMDGAEATFVIKKDVPGVAVFGFSAADGQGRDRLLRAGATGVLSKDSLEDLLVTLNLLFPIA